MERSHVTFQCLSTVVLAGTLFLLEVNGFGMRPKGLASSSSSSSSSSFNLLTSLSSLNLSSSSSDIAAVERNLLAFISSCAGATSNAALACPCAGNGKRCKDSLSICRNFKCICDSSISTYNSASNKCVAIASLSNAATTTTTTKAPITTTTATTMTTTGTTTTTTSPNVPGCSAKSTSEIAYFPLTSPAPTAAQINEIVNVHNTYRKEPLAKNMRKLSWNACAASNAQHLAATCPSDHDASDRKVPGFAQCGQNIAWNTGPTPYSWTQAIALWYNEKDNFRYCLPPVATNENPNAVVGHYTQLMWSDTTVVGCGMKTGCPAIPSLKLTAPVNVFVCNYCVGGNLLTNTNKYPDQYCPWEEAASAADKCTHCPSGTACQDSLCA